MDYFGLVNGECLRIQKKQKSSHRRLGSHRNQEEERAVSTFNWPNYAVSDPYRIQPIKIGPTLYPVITVWDILLLAELTILKDTSSKLQTPKSWADILCKNAKYIIHEFYKGQLFLFIFKTSSAEIKKLLKKIK
jgi:hypothetical protein